MSHMGEPGKVQKVPASDGRKLGSTILERGSVVACMPTEAMHVLDDLRTESYRFFQMADDVKLQYTTADHNFGFRPFRSQYSQSPDRPDLNESFAVWSDCIEEIPHYANLKRFTGSILAYREIVATISRSTLDAIRDYYNASTTLKFLRNSCVEINWYHVNEPRTLLQDKHEDGHLLTLLTADAPGLEVEIENVMTPIVFAPGEVLLMPGSLLTDITGGHIPAMYHQVRNYELFPRLSYLYQVNPEITPTLQPLIYTKQNLHVDLRTRVLEVGQSFGLPPAPLKEESTS